MSKTTYAQRAFETWYAKNRPTTYPTKADLRAAFEAGRAALRPQARVDDLLNFDYVGESNPESPHLTADELHGESVRIANTLLATGHYLAATIMREQDRRLTAALEAEFTDTSRGAIAWVLYHHQGSSSAIGQPLRFALDMGTHEPLSDYLIGQAKRWAAITGATTADFDTHTAAPAGVPDGDVRWLLANLRHNEFSHDYIKDERSCAACKRIKSIHGKLSAAPLAPHDAQQGAG